MKAADSDTGIVLEYYYAGTDFFMVVGAVICGHRLQAANSAPSLALWSCGCGRGCSTRLAAVSSDLTLTAVCDTPDSATIWNWIADLFIVQSKAFYEILCIDDMGPYTFKFKRFKRRKAIAISLLERSYYLHGGEGLRTGAYATDAIVQRRKAEPGPCPCRRQRQGRMGFGRVCFC